MHMYAYMHTNTHTHTPADSMLLTLVYQDQVLEWFPDQWPVLG